MQVDSPFSFRGDDALLVVRLTPRARRDAIGTVIDCGDGRSALSVRIAAPPVEGAANQALVALLAKALGIAKAAVSIEAGETSRLKRVRLRGVSEERLRALIH
jgi:uncharacterized protein (TIGR00251 family)